ncbi:hypothetical protein HCN44_009271 [Aphidius gifuensis]|uniref:Serine protease snake n=1 Tax=Aphidius gifuensis TaxID=684658 RepID=A0A834Y253_APHGI|nr:serine protease snake-like [Aphidius gifuensis]XP_044018084.1 serine protease snake-like [Aphidius gifuensis]KAF7997873.1 hypothetical protein HCN44_009271 [Aphidius gifuensis]
MLAPVFIIVNILAVLVASEQYEGDTCEVDYRTNGVCKFITECQVIYQQLLAGKTLDKKSLCGYDRFQPVVCCPESSSIYGTRPTTTRRPIISTTRYTTVRMYPTTTTTAKTFSTYPNQLTPGTIAKKMCAVYAKSVYALIHQPILQVNPRPINTSLCAIKSKKLIVGGTKADPKEFPHMAAIGFNSKQTREIFWLCGGTLVSEIFVLTAAHCTSSSEFGVASWVRVGDLNLVRNDDDALVQEKRVVERIRHSGHKKPSQYHDIALLRLESPVRFNAWVRPACLPTSPAILKPKRAIASGWGREDWTDKKGTDDLLKVVLDLVPHARCKEIFGSDKDTLKRGIIDEWQICAGEEGKDTCQGDSGGPLVVYDPDFDCMYDVIGLTSFGLVCGLTPGIYTRVNNYISWLEDKIWPNF